MTIILTENGKRIDEFEAPENWGVMSEAVIQFPVFCDLHVSYHTGWFGLKKIHDDEIEYERVMVGA